MFRETSSVIINDVFETPEVSYRFHKRFLSVNNVYIQRVIRGCILLFSERRVSAKSFGTVRG